MSYRVTRTEGRCHSPVGQTRPSRRMLQAE